MITWLQNLMLKHNSWLMGSLLVVIIFVFVLSVGPTGLFHTDRSGSARSVEYYGFDLNDPEVARELAAKAEISFALNRPMGFASQEDYIYARIAALGLANQMGIGNPTQEELQAYVRGLQFFQDPQTGSFSPQQYNQIADMIASGGNLTKADFTEMLREDWRVGQVVKALGGPGYTNPYIGFRQYQEANTTYDIAVAELDYTNFEFDQKVSDEELEAYYNQNPGAYTEPEKLEATAVIFPAQNFVDRVGNIGDNELRAYYDRNGWRYMGAPTTNPETGAQEQPQPLPFEEARPRVLADMKLERARALAARAAEDFTVELDEKGIARESEEFTKLVEARGAVTEEVQPYARDNPPANSRISAQVLNDLWNYSSGPRYYSSPAQTQAGGVVLMRDALVPETVPPFASVWEQVETNWRDENKQRNFTQKGQALRQQLQQAIASGTSFNEAAQDLGLTVREIEPFEGVQVPQEFLQDRSWEQARKLAANELTTMIQRQGKGTFIYIQSKEAPDVQPDAQEVQDYVAERSGDLGPLFGWQAILEIASETLRTQVEAQES